MYNPRLGDDARLRRIAMQVEYDGTEYHGFQLQRNAKSVQGALEEAIVKLTGHFSRVRGAGRTDAGVHAEGQVVTFDTEVSYPVQTIVAALNRYLSTNISIKRAIEVPSSFDPRRSALRRQYRYQIFNGTTPSPLLQGLAHHVSQSLDVVSMGIAARYLEGDKDFGPFCGPIAKGVLSTNRYMFSSTVTYKQDMVFLNMIATGFLPQQVRRTAGALLQVGLGKLSLLNFSELAEHGRHGEANKVLPAKGLFLVNIEYPTRLFDAPYQTGLPQKAPVQAGTS